MSDKGFCRPALATLGLLITENTIDRNKHKNKYILEKLVMVYRAQVNTYKDLGGNLL